MNMANKETGNIKIDKKLARFGMVNFINTAPIYEIWKETVDPEMYTVIEEPPSVLNRMLASDSIDLGFVSSYEYCVRPERYRILRDLSISATGSVGSVFLFSHMPLEELDNKIVLLSNQSETSVYLVKIILEEYYHLKPMYIGGGVGGEISKSCQAVLAIGDDALRLVSSGQYAYQFDLGEMWHTLTGLPFVFSVCAVQENFCLTNARVVKTIQQTLVQCREEGRADLKRICQLVAPRIPMEVDSCYTYLEALEYDLSDRKIKALEKYYGFLIQRQEASSNSLPLKFFP